MFDDATVTSYTRIAVNGALGKKRDKLWVSSVKVPKGQKQPFRGVLSKRCFGNVQRI